MDFLNTEHQLNYQALIEKDKTYGGDRERQALFFILASDDRLNRDATFIYDFEERAINPEALNSTYSHGEALLINLAFNLFNGWECPSPLDMFAVWDSNSREVAIQAIRVRFNF